MSSLLKSEEQIMLLNFSGQVFVATAGRHQHLEIQGRVQPPLSLALPAETPGTVKLVQPFEKIFPRCCTLSQNELIERVISYNSSIPSIRVGFKLVC
jgi:hypothetical protein